VSERVCVFASAGVWKEKVTRTYRRIRTGMMFLHLPASRCLTLLLYLLLRGFLFGYRLCHFGKCKAGLLKFQGCFCEEALWNGLNGYRGLNVVTERKGRLGSGRNSAARGGTDIFCMHVVLVVRFGCMTSWLDWGVRLVARVGSRFWRERVQGLGVSCRGWGLDLAFLG
jgi:hypothetical protein